MKPTPALIAALCGPALAFTLATFVSGAAAMPPGGGQAATASPHGSAAAATKPVKVTRATGPNAKTVAEIVAGKAALKDKPVLVRGQVVKVNNGILGKNWVHLQDGSGSAADGSHDILVTTTDKVAVGEVLNVSGTVRTNVEVGPGYSYAVMVDGATLRK